MLFAEDRGLSMRSCRIAAVLQNAGVATLVVEPFDEDDGEYGHNRGPPAMANHLAEVTCSVNREPQICDLPVGLLGLSSAGAAVHAAVAARDVVQAIVLLDGPAELALDDLMRIEAATLLVVGGRDREGLEWTRGLSRLLRCVHRVAVVEGTGRLFGEPGSLETAARLTTDWFLEHLVPARPLAPAESPPRDFSDWELAVPPMDR
jgi:putative phosphoribosyl transferase